MRNELLRLFYPTDRKLVKAQKILRFFAFVFCMYLVSCSYIIITFIMLKKIVICSLLDIQLDNYLNRILDQIVTKTAIDYLNASHFLTSNWLLCVIKYYITLLLQTNTWVLLLLDTCIRCSEDSDNMMRVP